MPAKPFLGEALYKTVREAVPGDPIISEERMSVLKRLLSIVLCIALGLAGVVFYGALSYDGTPERVAVSDFYFRNEKGEAVTKLENNMTLQAGCHIKGIGKESQPYIFMTVVYDGGKLIAASPSEGSIAPGEEKDVTAAVTLGADVSGYRVMSYLWSDLQSMELLASPATFGSSEAELASIEIDGIPVAGLKSGVYDYTVEVPHGSAGIPENISVGGKDLTIQSTITNMTEFPGTVQIQTMSHDGKNSKNYQVSVQPEPPETMTILAGKGASKIYYETSTKAFAIPHTENGSLASKLPVFSGSTSYLYLNFDLSSIPSGAVLQGGRLKFSSYAATGTGNQIEAFLCTAPDWDTFSSKGWAAFDETSPLSKTPVQIDGTAFEERVMEIDAGRVSGDTLTIMLRKNYLESAANVYASVDLKNNIPVLELDYYLD